MSASSPSPLSQPEAWNLVSPGYTELLLPEFTKYATDVLARVSLKATDRVLDVATGPGTMALLAAPNVAQVTGIDFAEQMVALAKKHVSERGFTNVALQVGDAQSLPFPDGSFDAAFSMFGLIFFPDRARGLNEIFRVLRPGGTIALTSWVPFAEIPLIQSLFAAIGRHLNTPFGSSGPPPLGSSELIHAELGAAGFVNIEATRTQHTTHAPTMRAYWDAMSRSNAPLVLVRKRLGDGWPAFEAGVVADLENEFGAGPQNLTMPAWISVAKRP
jgi:SAM-dependent methyltransferase